MTKQERQKIHDDYLKKREDFANPALLRAIFNKAKNLEDKLDKDLSCFVHDEIIDYLTEIHSSSDVTLRAYVSVVRGYCRWCLDNGYTNAQLGEWESITPAEINDCAFYVNSGSYITREQLDQYVNGLINPCDQFMLYAFYEGLSGLFYEDVWGLTADRINGFQKEVILSSGAVVGVSRELIACAHESINTYVYQIYRAPQNIFVEMPLKRDCPFTIKDPVVGTNPTPSGRSIRLTQKMLKIKKALSADDVLSIPRLKNSGFIWRIKERAKELNISEKACLMSPDSEDIRMQYSNEAKPFTLRARFFKYLDD